MRAENPTFLECAFDVRVDGTVLQAKTKSPLRSRVLLRLNSTHPADDVRGPSEPRSRDVLIQESSPGDGGEFSFHFEWSTCHPNLPKYSMIAFAPLRQQVSRRRSDVHIAFCQRPRYSTASAILSAEPAGYRGACPDMCAPINRGDPTRLKRAFSKGRTVRKSRRVTHLLLLECFLLLPAAAWAQLASGTIAGVVKDTSGAVMPGVTVEAASPALIERVRSVVTDEQGQYKIVESRTRHLHRHLHPARFQHGQAEGLELTTSFTATVNAEMKVGALEETVTVSGQAPVVDTQNIRQQTTIARGTLDAIPTTKRLGQYATIIPGATYCEPHTPGCRRHRRAKAGSSASTAGVAGDLVTNVEGMNQNLQAARRLQLQLADFQEVVVETSGASAEAVERRRPGEHRAQGRRQHRVGKLQHGLFRPEVCRAAT